MAQGLRFGCRPESLWFWVEPLTVFTVEVDGEDRAGFGRGQDGVVIGTVFRFDHGFVLLIEFKDLWRHGHARGRPDTELAVDFDFGDLRRDSRVHSYSCSKIS